MVGLQQLHLATTKTSAVVTAFRNVTTALKGIPNTRRTSTAANFCKIKIRLKYFTLANKFQVILT